MDTVRRFLIDQELIDLVSIVWHTFKVCHTFFVAQNITDVTHVNKNISRPGNFPIGLYLLNKVTLVYYFEIV
jgi:hypothetical protein